MGIARLKRFRPGYRATSVLAAAAVFGGAAFFVSSSAHSDTQALPRVFSDYQVAKAGKNRVHLPAKAHKTTRKTFKLGKTGPAFQAPLASTRIVGGATANAADHPYIIGLLSYFYVPDAAGGFETWISTCTGSVLSPTKVLTAAHCAVDLPLGSTYVMAGRNNLDDESGGFVTRPTNVLTSQTFGYPNNAPNNDFAVLTLADPLPSVYTPIGIAAQDDESWYADNTPGFIIGYGVTNSGVDDMNILRAANVPVRSDATCASALGAAYQNGSQACAGNPQAGIDTCHGDSGGPLIVTKNGVKTQVGITSWGPDPCALTYGAYTQISAFSNTIKADLTRKLPTNLDWTGDGHTDLLARTTSGELWLYSGNGLVSASYPDLPAFSGSIAAIGAGWQGFKKVFRVTNWNLDGLPSVMAVAANGNLLQYRSNGRGGWTQQAVAIGTGWTMFDEIMVTNNWTGDGMPNLLGRKPNGDLFLYTSDGNGAWKNGGVGIKIGNGWGMFNTILTPGDWRGDGHQSLIGRTPSGDLRLYQSDGHGGWVNGMGEKIGNGWEGFKIFMSPGDLNGDNFVDMIGITPGGDMRLYTTDGKGNWTTSMGTVIGGGWNMFTAVF